MYRWVEQPKSKPAARSGLMTKVFQAVLKLILKIFYQQRDFEICLESDHFIRGEQSRSVMNTCNFFPEQQASSYGQESK